MKTLQQQQPQQQQQQQQKKNMKYPFILYIYHQKKEIDMRCHIPYCLFVCRFIDGGGEHNELRLLLLFQRIKKLIDLR